MSDASSNPQPFWSRPPLQWAVVFLVALVARGISVLHYGPLLTNDSTYYLDLAHRFLNGGGLGPPSRVMPVYPLFVACVTAVCASPWAIVWTQAVLGALTCGVILAICRRLFQPKPAVVLALAVAVYLPLAAFAAVLMRETLIALAVSLTTYCLVRMMQDGRTLWSWAAGVACVLTLFCQPTFLFFPFWMGLAVWVRRKSLAQAVRALVPVVACLAIAIGLWTARNYALTSRFIPFTGDHVGCYFLEGIMDANGLRPKRLTDDQIQFLGLSPDNPHVTYTGLRDHYICNDDLDQKLRDGPVLFSWGLKLVRHQPAAYLRFSLRRLHRLWLKDLWVERDPEGSLNVRPLDELRTGHGIAGKLVVAVIYLFGYASLVGMIVFGRRLAALWAPVATVLLFHMWVHAETRYALAVHPHLLIFSILGVWYLWLWYRRKTAAEIGRLVLAD